MNGPRAVWPAEGGGIDGARLRAFTQQFAAKKPGRAMLWFDDR